MGCLGISARLGGRHLLAHGENRGPAGRRDLGKPALAGDIAWWADFSVHQFVPTGPGSTAFSPAGWNGTGRLNSAFQVECHQALGSTLAAAKAEMDATASAAQEEARKKAEERKKKSKKPADKPADAAPSTVPTHVAPTGTASLFGDSQPTASQVNPTGCVMPGSMKMLASKSNDTRRTGARSLDNSSHSSWQCLMFFSQLLRMTYGLTLRSEEEPTQVQIRPRGGGSKCSPSTPPAL